jgi:hypothetical protein
LISMFRKCTCFSKFSMYSSSMFRLGFKPIPIEGLLARFFWLMPSGLARRYTRWRRTCWFAWVDNNIITADGEKRQW